jgi:hypothetical protein
MAQYEIIIKDQTTAKASSPIADNTDTGSVKSTNLPTPADETTSAREKVGTYFAVKRVVSPFVSTVVNYRIGTIALSSGANEQQARVQSAYSLGQQAIGMVENIAIGGAVGGLPGAVAGVVMGVASTVTNVVTNQMKIDKAQDIENISIGLMNARAGGSVATINGSRRG